MDRESEQNIPSNVEHSFFPFDLLHQPATDDLAHKLGYESLDDMKVSLCKARIITRVYYQAPVVNWSGPFQPQPSDLGELYGLYHAADEIAHRFMSGESSDVRPLLTNLFDNEVADDRASELSATFREAVNNLRRYKADPQSVPYYQLERGHVWQEALLGDPPPKDFAIEDHAARIFGFRGLYEMRLHIMFHVVKDCMDGNWKRYEQYPQGVGGESFYKYVHVVLQMAQMLHKYFLGHNESDLKVFETHFLLHSQLAHHQASQGKAVCLDLLGTAKTAYHAWERKTVAHLLHDIQFEPPDSGSFAENNNIVAEENALRELLLKKLMRETIVPAGTLPRELLGSISTYHPKAEDEKAVIRIAAAEYLAAEARGLDTSYKAQKALERLFPDSTHAHQAHKALIAFYNAPTYSDEEI